MGVETKIQWCHHTWNPWRGCVHDSPGCDNCYAELLSFRNPTVLGEWGPNGKRAIAAESYWDLPRKWNEAARKAGERRRVFCLSLGDVFEDRAELVEPRARLFAMIERTHNLDWLLLTKRPQNVERLIKPLESKWYPDMPLWETFPLPNVWLGVSVEDQQRADQRIPTLLRIPATVRFLSVEPLLESVDLRFFDSMIVDIAREMATRAPRKRPNGVSWAIVGGESGSNARPCDVAWVQSVVAQCREAGVAPFVKQLGAVPVDGGVPIIFRDKKGGDPDEWPEDLRVRELPD